MKKLVKVKNKMKEKLTILSGSFMSAFILFNSRVFAASNTSSIDGFINFACDWLTKIRWCCCISWWCNVCIRVAT